jgi:hypothetical protein
MRQIFNYNLVKREKLRTFSTAWTAGIGISKGTCWAVVTALPYITWVPLAITEMVDKTVKLAVIFSLKKVQIFISLYPYIRFLFNNSVTQWLTVHFKLNFRITNIRKYWTFESHNCPSILLTTYQFIWHFLNWMCHIISIEMMTKLFPRPVSADICRRRSILELKTTKKLDFTPVVQCSATMAISILMHKSFH